MIIGQNDRTSLIPQKYTQAGQAIGLIEQLGGSLCNAFCVRPDVVVTNAHCVFDPKGKWRNKKLEFVFEYRPKRRFLKRAPIQGEEKSERLLNIVFGMRRGRTKSGYLNHHDDWALLRIKPGVCKAQLPVSPTKDLVKLSPPPIALFSVVNDWIGSAIDYHKRLSTDCRFVRSIPGLSKQARRAYLRETRGNASVLHTCDTKQGQSGSPILWEDGDGRVSVVAVNTGYRRYSDNYRENKPQFYANTAAPASAFYRSLERFASEGTVGAPHLTRIQRRLRKLGYLKSRADGVFGPATREAIHRFERRKKMPRLGLPTVELMKKLRLPKPAP